MIVITGASDGLGLELAKLYKSDGKTVVNISRHASKYADVNITHDLQKGNEVHAAAEEVFKLKEPLEAIVNCAGVFSYQDIGSITEEEIDRTMAINVKAPILFVSDLLERIKRDGADIVNISSTAGTKAYQGQAVYSTSKWALRGFSTSLQLELKDYPCRVISFCPGGFKTKLFEKATGVDKTEDGTEWMSASDVARHVKQVLELPKNMEITEVVVNRKQVKTLANKN